MTILLDGHIRDHLKTDTFSTHQISGFCLTRHQSYLVFKDRDTLSLYDLITRRTLWSCEVEKQEGFQYAQAQVSLEGRVLYVTRNSSTDEQLCQIFLEGKVQSSFTCPMMRLQSLQLVDDKVVGLPSSQEEKYFYLWDKTLKTISFEDLTDPIQSFNASKDFYVVLTQTSFFAYDFFTQRGKYFAIPSISTSFIEGNTLHCGTSLSQIHAINLVSGKSQQTYSLHPGEITAIHANRSYTVFKLSNGNDHEIGVIDRKTDQIRYIPTFPEASDGVWTSFNFYKKLLTICYPIGSWQANSAKQIFCIYNLATHEIIRKVSYKRFPQCRMTFDNGQLVLMSWENYREGVYAEDYLDTSGSSKEDVKKWQRKALT